MKTTYTPLEAQTYLELTPPMFALLWHKYKVEAQNNPQDPTVPSYSAPDVERVRFEIHRRRSPFITLLNADYAPDFGLQFCRMLKEACGAPLAVVSVAQATGAEQLGAVVPGPVWEADLHRYQFPAAKTPSSDFLLAWEGWEKSLDQLADEYARVVLLVESKARLLDYVLLATSSICLLLLPHLAAQVNELLGELHARLRVARRLQAFRQQLELAAVVVVGMEEEAEGRRLCERLQAEQPGVVFVLPDLSDAESYLPFWYRREREEGYVTMTITEEIRPREANREGAVPPTKKQTISG